MLARVHPMYLVSDVMGMLAMHIGYSVSPTPVCREIPHTRCLGKVEVRRNFMDNEGLTVCTRGLRSATKFLVPLFLSVTISLFRFVISIAGVTFGNQR